MSTKEERRAFVLNGVLDGRWTVAEAAGLLGVSVRQVWRLRAAYREAGIRAVVHGNRGRKPRRATEEAVQAQVVALAQGAYDGANYAHLADLLREREGRALSRWTVRRILQAAGVRSPRRRRPSKHRSRRERYPQEGMLLQVDGSRHRWLGPEGPWLTLVGGIDDATGAVPYALFREQEDAQGYLLLLQGVVAAKGCPLSLYSDRHSIFVHSSREPETLEEELRGRREPTQVARALEELGIQWIGAASPQAKGRIERLWQTFQDRLVMELRLAGATTLEEANRVLWAFLPKFNAQFGVPAREAGLGYRPVPQGLDLAGVLCFQYSRTVAADNTVSFGGRAYQLPPDNRRASYARARIQVQERLDGSLVFCYQGRVLAATPAAEAPITLRARKGQRSPSPAAQGSLGVRVSPQGAGAARGEGGPATEGRRPPAAKQLKPAPNHPWRNYLRWSTDKITAPDTLT